MGPEVGPTFLTSSQLMLMLSEDHILKTTNGGICYAMLIPVMIL